MSGASESGLIVPEWLQTSLPQFVGGRVPVSEDNRLRGLRKEMHQAASTQREPLSDPAMSAVLVLVSGNAQAQQRPDDASVVLTHRATTLRSHAGQMSFPGGRVDPGDRDAIDTALREAEEETGLNRDSVTPLQVMNPIDISRTGFAVHPVLAYWNDPHELQAVDPAETESVINVPISHLVDPENRMMLGYSGWTGPGFRIGDFVVWGFTGGVLSYLLDAAGWAEDWDNNHVQDLITVLAKSANGENLSMLKGAAR